MSRFGFLALAIFHTRQLLRTPFFVQQAFAAPLSFGLLRLFGSWGAGVELPNDLWFETALAGMWATTTTAVGIIGFQRFQGTLEYLAMSTRRPGSVFGSLCAAASVLGLVGLPISLAFQYLTTGSVQIDVAHLVGFMIGTLACIASAFALASIFVLSRSATVYEPLILTPVWLLSGIVVPLAALPQWVLPFAAIHPLTGAVLATDANTAIESLTWIGESLVAAAFWTLTATFLLSRALHRARVRGTLALA